MVCSSCGWATAGVWAREEAEAHQAVRRGPHVLVVHFGVDGPAPLRLVGCHACDMYAFFDQWLGWEARSIKLWSDHAELHGFEDGYQEIDPDGYDEHWATKPSLPTTLSWLQGFDEHDSVHQQIASLMPLIACRDHDPMWSDRG